MDFNLRQAVIQNLVDSDAKQLKDTVLDAIQSGEEKMLPGLGVLFELMWENCSEDKQSEVISVIQKGLKNS